MALTITAIHHSGTAQPNRKGLPVSFRVKRKPPRGTVESFCSGNILALSLTDKRRVIMVSTKHSVEMVQVRSRYVTHACTKLITYKILSKYLVPFIRSTSRMIEKPQVVVDYNEYMLGVDKLDELASYYSFLHKSVKWWRKVFFRCVEVAVINAYIVYKEQAQSIDVRPMCHLAFQRQLIEHLSEPLRSTAPPGPRRGPRVRQSLEQLP